MPRTEADLRFEALIREALDKYAEEEYPQEVLTDWVIVFTRQKIDDEGDVVFANSYTSPKGSNPNTNMGLMVWAEGTMCNIMTDIDDDD